VNAPPSINLALMAWRLAQMRVLGCNAFLFRPVARDLVDEETRSSTEYYHILRRIEDGEAP
jgi:hypothetical protein